MYVALTYRLVWVQSAHQLREAQRELGWQYSFDLASFDEAHHTATMKHTQLRRARAE